MLDQQRRSGRNMGGQSPPPSDQASYTVAVNPEVQRFAVPTISNRNGARSDDPALRRDIMRIVRAVHDG